MSGICGFISDGDRRPVREAIVRRMTEAMRVDPDDPVRTACSTRVGFGAYLRASSCAGTGIVEEGGVRLAIAWEGEIANLDSLAKEYGPDLPPGDVPLLLSRLYRESGERIAERLEGAFSLAIGNGEKGELLLIVDRFGIRPLYYHESPGWFGFASKLRGLLVDRTVPRDVNLAAIVRFLDASVIHGQDTILQGIRRLAPGSVLRWNRGEIRIRPYWDIRYEEDAAVPQKEYSARVREALAGSVSSCLRISEGGDGIAAFLSGGIDSSTVVGLMREASTGRNVHAFTIGFDVSQFNEMEYARIAARHFQVEHHEHYVTPAATLDAIPVLAAEYDEPFANASAVPTYLCAKAAREAGMRVLFAGDGGDELFAGNERYGHDLLFQYYHRIPAPVRNGVFEPVVRLLSGLRIPPFPKGMKYIRRANLNGAERMYSYSISRTIPMYEEMLTGDLQRAALSLDPFEPFRERYDLSGAASELNRFMYLDLKGAIAENDLPKVTRMTEVAGIRVLFPFLDRHLAEISGKIPSRLKMRGKRLRSFFKNSYGDFLPPEIIGKTKHGFGLPIPVWLKTDPRLRELSRELVLSGRSLERGYFRRTFLESVFDQFETDTTSFYGTLIWNLMMLELWHRHHLESPVERGCTGE